MTVPSIDTLNINHIAERLIIKYGLNVRSITQIDRCFERALAITLFHDEREVDSISYTLNSQHDW